MRLGNWRLWMAGLALGPVLLAPVVDVAQAYVKPRDGCRVVGIIDGDTVRMICRGEGLVSGRLLGFDTPEISARCMSEAGRAWMATQYLRWRVWSGWRIAAPMGEKDRYGRVLVRMTIDGEPVARMMIARGLARTYEGGWRAGWCGSGDEA
ncbi:thermonuclease family protein [Vannielia litorea]|uniref:thermonuclease family protein n=1 Tax=Vannielia litorea TaxID=1217970 RepID=UPI00158815E1|nr:thermonuclease family protein [Vannielia litorea]